MDTKRITKRSATWVADHGEAFDYFTVHHDRMDIIGAFPSAHGSLIKLISMDRQGIYWEALVKGDDVLLTLYPR